MSETATLTRVPGALRTASRISDGLNGVGIAWAPLCRWCMRPSRRILAHGLCGNGIMRAMADARPPSALSPAGALVALHVAVALFGFAGLFGKWIAWDPVAIVLGRTVVAAVVLAFVVR